MTLRKNNAQFCTVRILQQSDSVKNYQIDGSCSMHGMNNTCQTF